MAKANVMQKASPVKVKSPLKDPKKRQMYIRANIGLYSLLAPAVYRVSLQEAQYSLTTAIGLTQSLLGFILLRSANWLSGKIAGLGLY